MNKKNTAILLFSRTAATEAKEKPLAMGQRASESIAGFLINHVKKLAHQTQLPVFFISEKQQRGESFGERFANAFDDVFQQGFERVIAIGNDCLSVTTQNILTATKALQATPSVLGATSDGGAYLIGFQSIAFQKQDFQNISWQSKDTFSELVAFIDNQNHTCFFLPEKLDIDTISDWRKALQSVSIYIKKQLLRLFNIGKNLLPKSFSRPINDQFLSVSRNLRAPPLAPLSFN